MQSSQLPCESQESSSSSIGSILDNIFFKAEIRNVGLSDNSIFGRRKVSGILSLWGTGLHRRCFILSNQIVPIQNSITRNGPAGHSLAAKPPRRTEKSIFNDPNHFFRARFPCPSGTLAHSSTKPVMSTLSGIVLWANQTNVMTGFQWRNPNLDDTYLQIELKQPRWGVIDGSSSSILGNHHVWRSVVTISDS